MLGLPRWHLCPMELVGVMVPTKPWLAGDGTLGATLVVVEVMWLWRMVL